MSMRMQELSERSGLPKTTIHHYIREGLLPPARKTAPNAAVYEEEHLERLRLIGRLRAEEFGELSIPDIRRVLEHREAGLGTSAAVRLLGEGVEPDSIDSRDWTELEDFATAAGVPLDYARALDSLGMLDGGDGLAYDAGDLLVVRACHAADREWDLHPEDLVPIADLIREVGNYSTTLAEVHAATIESADDTDRQGLLGRLAECSRAMLWRALEG